ncbi:MAG TPA: rod shape-determining protein MreC [Pseudomonadales bacterium]|nr:rod shape-determining protein MreC [Pseudomonadales bacterium]
MPVTLALLLLGVGYYKPDILASTRGLLADNVARPLYWLTSFPVRAWEWTDETLSSRQALEDRNHALEHENLILQRNVLRMAALMAENARLKELLNSTELLDDSALVAELLGVSPDPRRQEILIHRGHADGVFEGQPVLDAFGLVGSVIEISEHTARVLLIADTSNAVPVQVNRNGVRGIAEGSGHLDELYIRNLVPTTDIKEGDLIISSGLGGRYPPGYPVGEVVRIEYEGADSFLRVVVRPSAHLDRSQQLLLVFRAEAQLPEVKMTEPAATEATTPPAQQPADTGGHVIKP